MSAKRTAAQPAPITLHGALGEIGIELLAVMCLVVLAGSSRRGATTALVLTTTLWTIAAIVHYRGDITS